MTQIIEHMLQLDTGIKIEDIKEIKTVKCKFC